MKKRRRLQKSDVMWLLAAALMVLLQFWWLPGDPGTPDDSYSNAIEGKRGLYRTLESLSQAGVFPPVRRETVKLVPDEPATLLLLSPDRYPNIHEQEELSNFVYSGGTLLFAPNWSEPDCTISQLSIRTSNEYFMDEDTTVTGTTAPTTTSQSSSTTQADSQSEADPTPESTSQQSRNNTPTPPVQTKDNDDNDLADELDSTPGLLPNQTDEMQIEDPNAIAPVSNLQTNSTLVRGSVRWRTRASMREPSRQSTVLVRTSSGTTQAASWPYGKGLVVVSASSDVFSNQALLFEDEAELAIRLVEYAHAHHKTTGNSNAAIVVNESLNASDSYRGTAVLMSPGLRSGTLQLILIACLAGWYGFHRFGPPVRSRTAERRSLTESAVAVGNLQFRAQGGAASVKSYLDYLRNRLRHLFSGTVTLDDYTALAHRTGVPVEDIRQHITEAVNLSKSSHCPPGQAAAVIRRLAEIHGKLTGTTKKQPGSQEAAPNKGNRP